MLGLEQIVLSGGAYSYREEDFKYNFIEPAIKKLRELKNDNYYNENITWLIADAGWSNDEKEQFRDVAREIGVGIEFIDSKETLFNYINYKYNTPYDSRINDRITKFVVFSHGFADGTLSLGYDYSPSYNDNLDISIWDINTDNLKTYDAFDNPNSAFYSCNTGRDISGEFGSNFAQRWVNITGGKTWAFVGKTDYSNINKGQGVFIWNSRREHGFSYYGSANYPVASNGAWVNAFWR